jgi:xanthosine utilization system XapX-like protein
MKLIFAPVSIVLGLIAGLVGKKLFEGVWGLIDEEEPPSSEHRELSWPKLVAALVLEGAIFRLVKGLVDHGSRSSFARLTGTWPGEEAPEPE